MIFKINLKIFTIESLSFQIQNNLSIHRNLKPNLILKVHNYKFNQAQVPL